jgi:hypothetical protein
VRRVGAPHSTWRTSAKSKIARETALSARSSLRCDDGLRRKGNRQAVRADAGGRSPSIGILRFAPRASETIRRLSDRCSPASRTPDTRGSARDRSHCLAKISA